MATTCTSKPVPVKKLKEHLQEQQEPFKLSTYVSERRYSMKKFSSDGENNHGTSNSVANLKEPCSSSLRNRRILHAPRNLKSLFKFITAYDRQELSSSNQAVKEKLVSETIDMIQHIAETNWFSAVSNITPCSASSEFDYGASEHDDCFLAAEVSQVLNVRNSEEEKMYNSHGDARKLTSNLSAVTGLKDLTSAFLLKSLVKSRSEKHGQVSFTGAEETLHPGSSKSQRRNERVLPQSRRLLLDCIKRAIMLNVRNNERQKHLHKLFSLEELGKIIHEQVCTLGKQLANATGAARLTNFDFSGTPEEWNYFRQTKVKICREMGDSIIEEIIDEIIDLQ